MKPVAVQSKVRCIFKREVIQNNSKHKSIRTVATKELDPLLEEILKDETNMWDIIITEKVDGTCCLIRNQQLWKRYDRKLSKQGEKKKDVALKNGLTLLDVEWDEAIDFKEAPKGWIKADNVDGIDESGHCPGWVVVEPNIPESKWHATSFDFSQQKAFLLSPVNYIPFEDVTLLSENLKQPILLQKQVIDTLSLNETTLELIGSKINNCYSFPKDEKQHYLIPHGNIVLLQGKQALEQIASFEKLKQLFVQLEEQGCGMEGIVIHCRHKQTQQECLFKLHRHHLDLPWPLGANQTHIRFSSIINDASHR